MCGRSSLRRRRPQTGARSATEHPGRCLGGVTGLVGCQQLVKEHRPRSGSERGCREFRRTRRPGRASRLSQKTAANPRCGSFCHGTPVEPPADEVIPNVAGQSGHRNGLLWRSAMDFTLLRGNPLGVDARRAGIGARAASQRWALAAKALFGNRTRSLQKAAQTQKKPLALLRGAPERTRECPCARSTAFSTPRCHSRRALVPPSPRRMRRSPFPPGNFQRLFDRSDLSPTSTTGWSADGARLALARLSPPMALPLLSRSPTPPASCAPARVRAGWVLPVLVDRAKCLACCLKSSDALAGLLPYPRSAWLRQVFPRPRFPGRFRYSRRFSSTPT